MKTLEQRFFEKVNKNGPVPEHVPHLGKCWVWTAYKQKTGYGIVGVPGKKGATALAHRVSYELNVSPIPEGLWVLHKCDNRACVRPDHLFLGDVTDNNRDCLTKGRHRSPNGEKTHCPKGHEYAVDGFYATKSGGRQCKPCFREHAKNYRRKNIETVREKDKERRPRKTTGDNFSGAPRRI